MNKNIIKKALLPTVACGTLLATASTYAQTTIADWTFENITAGTTMVLNPAAAVNNSAGTPAAVSLGMDNTYGTPTSSMAIPDVIASTGSSTGAGNEWRVRGGPVATGKANGWSSLAPIGTQGAEFDVSTVGFSNIQLTFDLETTSAAEANLTVLYTTDGMTWNNATIISLDSGATIKNNTSSANTVMGSYITMNANGFVDGITVDFGGITAANNDASFGVRIVNASTGADDLNGSGTAYNNSSGNWRYDNVAFSTPEPTILALTGLGLAGLFGFRRKFAQK
ncbi:MAG TPA: PEP-CTERM sorting domain-containing protein [Verrucomicrobiae bacterium]|jgi:hypothetical protein|nr:PEP-CTERM sorting domain-containing protein [Verrucomicrobiae bacterium]